MEEIFAEWSLRFPFFELFFLLLIPLIICGSRNIPLKEKDAEKSSRKSKRIIVNSNDQIVQISANNPGTSAAPISSNNTEKIPIVPKNSKVTLTPTQPIGTAKLQPSAEKSVPHPKSKSLAPVPLHTTANARIHEQSRSISERLKSLDKTQHMETDKTKTIKTASTVTPSTAQPPTAKTALSRVSYTKSEGTIWPPPLRIVDDRTQRSFSLHPDDGDDTNENFEELHQDTYPSNSSSRKTDKH